LSRPNVLYLHSHDTGRYVQPYGHAVPTPSLQRLAEEGVLFRSCFCAAPTCSASRAALLTGQWPHVSGMIGLAHRGFALNDHTQLLSHTLRRAGYHTALLGVQHVASRENVNLLGYDTCEPDGPVARVAPKAVEFLKAAPRQPFFLDVGFFETHREFPAHGPDDDPRFCLPPAPLPDRPETRADLAGFKASARELDRGVGLVLEALAANGLAGNTLVLCTTDHGIAFPHMKCNLTDHGLGVMLFLRGPGGFTGGRVCDALVSHVDLYPTLCELLEIPPPRWLQGRSILPVIRGERAEVREELFAEVTYHAAYEPQRAVRTRRWKYIRRFDPRPTPVLPNCDDSLSKDVLLGHGWREQPVPGDELYDLVFDPCETCNRARDPAAAGPLAEMRGRLDRSMRETDDPLLRGPVPAPKGARVNDPAGLSPNEPTREVR
jgi:arylsulfatase A-like enzyme